MRTEAPALRIKCVRCEQVLNDPELFDDLLAEVVDKGGTLPAEWVCPRAPDRGPHESYKGPVVFPGGHVGIVS